MNRETVMTTLDYYHDDHTAFYHWMSGYMCGTEDGPGYIHVDENGKERPIDFSGVEDKWIVHNGLGRPVPPLVRVRIKIKDGVGAEGYAENFSWVNTGRASDITAYRIVGDE